MWKRLKQCIVAVALFSFMLIPVVYAQGYEVETVGGVLEPTNFIMTMIQTVSFCILIFALAAVVVLFRLKRTHTH